MDEILSKELQKAIDDNVMNAVESDHGVMHFSNTKKRIYIQHV